MTCSNAGLLALAPSSNTQTSDRHTFELDITLTQHNATMESSGHVERNRDHHRRHKERSSEGGRKSSKKRSSRHRDSEGDNKKRKRRDRDEDRSLSSSSSSSSSFSYLSDDDGRRSKKRRKEGDAKGGSSRRKKESRSRKDERRRGSSSKKERKRDRKKHKKHKRHKKDKKRSSSTRSQSRSRSASSSSHSRSDNRLASPTIERNDRLRRNHDIAAALCDLLSAHPKLSTELPIILIRMAGGTTFDLSGMPDALAARGLAQVFEALGQFGVRKDVTGSWMWDDGSGGGGGGVGRSRRPGTELFLLKLVRSLLDEIGITADAAGGYEERKRREYEAAIAAEKERQREVESASAAAAAKKQHHEEDRDDGSEIRARAATRSLFDKFLKKKDEDSSSLPSELGGIVNLILEGESIVLDGIPDEDLRGELEILFCSLGLVKSEIEEDSDEEEDDEDDKNGGPAMGYALPEDGSGEALVRANVLAVLDECRGSTENTKSVNGDATKKRVIGPAMGPPPGFSASQALEEYAAAPAEDDSDDEDDGPAPIGSEMARRRQRIGRSISVDTVRAMATQRQLKLADVASGGTGELSAAAAGGREELMLTPGKHDFLKGIKSADPTKSRKFKNEKARGGADVEGAGPQLTVEQQAEVDAIRRRLDEARGPTLIDQHRQKKAEEKEAARQSGKDKDFNWNRDRDLDAGRRVDKDHLHMVLGGAKEGLKDKFQGSFSRGFM